MSLVILTGASGSGKTTIARAFARRHPDVAEVCFFDSIGVPAPEEMVRQFGSGEEWQRLKTIEWLGKINGRLSTKPVLFEGQMRLSFIHDAARARGIANHTVLLVDCDDRTRRERLTRERAQPGLASDEMMRWAHYLREEAMLRGDAILDTSRVTADEAVEIVRRYF